VIALKAHGVTQAGTWNSVFPCAVGHLQVVVGQLAHFTAIGHVEVFWQLVHCAQTVLGT
jgi:hypothetical protein